jgi:HlyD family secretion protein
MQAQANVSTAQAQYDLMMAGYRDEEIAQAAAAVKQAQAAYDYAQNFYQRQQGLWKSRTISANDLENARSSRDQAQATLKSAQDKLSQYRAGNRPQEIAQAKASLEQAQAQLAQAQLDLHDTTGVAFRRHADDPRRGAGQHVQRREHRSDAVADPPGMGPRLH